MKLLQLFNRKIEGDDLRIFLQCFGITSIEDNHIFTKYDMRSLETCKKLSGITPMLKTYYIPCKALLYLADITEAKAITILRQVLRIYDYDLVGVERNINKEKQICYCIQSPASSVYSNNTSNVVLDFA